MIQKSFAAWLLPVCFVLWLFFVIGNFFVVQKPFGGANALAFIRVLLDVGVALWLGLIALGVGSWLLGRMWPIFIDKGNPRPACPSQGEEQTSPLAGHVLSLSKGGIEGGPSGSVSFAETVILGLGLGFGVLGLLSFALGLLGFFQPFIFYSLTIALTLLAFPYLIKLYRRLPSPQPSPPKGGIEGGLSAPELSYPNLPSTVYCLLIALFTVLLALLPPTDWDGLFYHLTGPKLYIEAGGIVGGIDIPHLSFPSLMEMLFTWAMLLRGDIAAKLLHTQFAFLLAGLVYLTARNFFQPKAAWPAVVVLLSMPLVGTLAGWAYNDLALAFYQLASVYALLKWRLGDKEIGRLGDEEIGRFGWRLATDKGVSWLVLSGIFAGLAMGLKYTSFVTPVTISLLILWYSLRTTYHALRTTWIVRGAWYVVRPLAIFSLPALLSAAPWYLKNWAFTGNPVYPFLYGLFGGQFWDGFRAEWYAAAGSGIGWEPQTLLTLPWLLTLGVHDVNYWDGRTGPLLLLFLPFILLFSIPRLKAWLTAAEEPLPVALTPLLIYVLAHFAVWTLGVIWSRSLWQSRLLLPGLVGLAPLAGWVWAALPRFDQPQFKFSHVVNLAIALTLALTLVDVGLLTLKIDPLPYLTGLESRDAYLTRRLGAHYAAMQEINATLPAEAVVAFLWEPKSYYCRRDCRPDSILDEFPHLVDQYHDPAAIAAAWHERGITHILLHRSGLNFVVKESPESVEVATLAALEADVLTLVTTVGGYELYALEPVHD